ncbi:GT2 family glycosyltransferase [Ilumatobacter fluminis]|uniref:GT2 family glycosyltransferase n=1 Tax=Ilumatobacter fluminis TaxID=467091 RepID=A0A4R7I159_9ACTN|nr:glycosyltransferase [Ilumatobacter fluminis]TDT17287.1 GT2 family glycosyltransferase [Ilumatobacter fluminis]
MSSHERGDITAVPVVVVTMRPPTGVLERCVRSLLDTSPGDGRAIEVIVVDNGGSARARLDAAGLVGVEVIETHANVGFGAAANVGLDHAVSRQAEAVAVLNDDVFVRSGWLAPLLDHLASGRVAAAQPLIVRHAADPPTVESVGRASDAAGAVSDLGAGRSPSDFAGAAPGAVPAVSSVAAVYSTDFVQDVGGFDERFFVGYADLELGRRGSAAGWTFAVVPGSVVEHVGSATTSMLGPGLVYFQERNRLWDVALHGGAAETARAIWLSVRRVRHEPRTLHRRALLDGAVGMPRRWLERARSSTPSLRDRSRRTGPDPMATRPTTGVNVVGYHHISSGLGDAARSFTACLRAAGADVLEIDNDVSQSPRRHAARTVTGPLHDTTVAFVTAFEFADFCERHPELVGPGRRMIGYWFWELSTVPPLHAEAMRLADEVWTPTTFVRDAYGSVADPDRPVRLMPIPLPRPEPDAAATSRWRAELGDAFAYLVSFDYLSIPERKNPHAAIAAFRSAFPDREDDSVRLVVKTINRERRPDDAAAIEALAAGDDRIVFVDCHLDENDHHGLIAAVDCLVSPHRSEGLGLQPALAMWFRTPVVATRYGGVVDYLDDDNAWLCGYTEVGVDAGEGIYPQGAPWADVDVDELAEQLRRVRADDGRRAQVVEAAHARIAAEPEPAEFGRRYLEALRTLRPA